MRTTLRTRVDRGNAIEVLSYTHLCVMHEPRYHSLHLLLSYQLFGVNKHSYGEILEVVVV